MTTTTIKKNIARAIEIKQIMATLDTELKGIKAALTLEADSREDEQAKTVGGGWSWRHADHEGNIVCVTEPARSLKGTLDPEAEYFSKVKAVAGKFFSQLFTQVPAYKPVDEFRVQALALLDKADAKKLIKLVTTDSKTKVSFEVAGKEVE